MPLLKQCSHRNCRKLLNHGVRFCDYHQNKYDEEQKERYKEYQSRRLQDREEKKAQEFYNTKAWKRVRTSVISDCAGIDIYEYYATGDIVSGETVHHILELKESWNSRLDVSNLIYITEKNHRSIHIAYEKSEKDKKLMQNKLFELINRFVDEFGL